MEVYKFPTLNGIMITLHGSFDEVAQPEVDGSASSAPSGPRGGSRYHSGPKHKRIPLSKKSFDRTFVVIPGPNGSMIVASDTLLIRPYTSDFPWKVQNCLPIQLPLHQVFQLPQLRHHSHQQHNSTTSTTWYRTNYSRFTSRYKGSIKSNTTRVVGEDIARDKVKH